MNHRERIIKTLNGEPVDRIAHGEFFFADEFVRTFFSLDADAHIRHADHVALVEQLDLDVAPVALSWGWGSPQQPNEDHALESIARWHAESDRFVFAVIDGPFSAATKTAGFDALMKYIHSVPNVARGYFQRGADEAHVVAQAVRDAGADGVVLGEDIAYNRSTFFSPKQLRECYFPVLARVVHDIREMGLATFFHSDGNLSAILADLAVCELDGLQGMEPEAQMSVRGVREKIGGRLTLWGNPSFDFLSASRTDAEIYQAIKSIVDGNGKVILGSCGGLVDGLNIETVRRIHLNRSIGA